MCLGFVDLELEDAPPPKKKRTPKVQCEPVKMTPPYCYVPQYQPAPAQTASHNACCAKPKSAPCYYIPQVEPAQAKHTGAHCYVPQVQHAPSAGIAGSNTWWGRTEAQVKLDNEISAKKKAAAAAAAQPNAPVVDRHWVRELNGQWVGKSRVEIETQCQPGTWYPNKHDGGWFFCRTK